MKHIVIRFIYTPGIISWLIAFVTFSYIDHCEVLSRDGSGWTGAHAGTGLQKRKLNWCKPRWERIYAIRVPQQMFEAAHDWLEGQIGLEYDYIGVLGIFLRRRIHSNKGRDCSNVVIRMLQIAGVQPLNVLSDFDYLITPETLHLSPIFIGRGITL